MNNINKVENSLKRGAEIEAQNKKEDEGQKIIEISAEQLHGATPEELDKWLGLSEEFGEMGYRVKILSKEDSSNLLGNTCYVSRALNTCFSSAGPNWENDKSSKVIQLQGGLKRWWREYDEEGLYVTEQNPRVTFSRKSGMWKMESDEDGRKQVDFSSSPFNKMTQPAYLIGGADNQWKRGGARSKYMPSRPPLYCDVYFTIKNPLFRSYISDLKTKIEGLTAEELMKNHLDGFRESGINIELGDETYKELEEYSQLFCNDFLPQTKKVIDELMEGEQSEDGFYKKINLTRSDLGMGEDGAFLIFTTFPIINPLMPYMKIFAKNPELFEKFEKTMIEKYKNYLYDKPIMDLVTMVEFGLTDNCSVNYLANKELEESDTLPNLKTLKKLKENIRSIYGSLTNTEIRSRVYEFRNEIGNLFSFIKEIQTNELMKSLWFFYKSGGKMIEREKLVGVMRHEPGACLDSNGNRVESHRECIYCRLKDTSQYKDLEKKFSILYRIDEKDNSDIMEVINNANKEHDNDIFSKERIIKFLEDDIFFDGRGAISPAIQNISPSDPILPVAEKWYEKNKRELNFNDLFFSLERPVTDEQRKKYLIQKLQNPPLDKNDISKLMEEFLKNMKKKLVEMINEI